MSLLTSRRLLGLSALSLLMAPSTAHAQDIFFPNDTTFDATNTIAPPGTAVIGYANFDDYINGVNPTSPTISIVTGANVEGLEVHNSSIINMSDGTVSDPSFGGRLLSDDTSIINISGGNVAFDLDVQSASTVNFSGGTVGDDIVTHDDTTVNMSGGIVDQDLLINDHSTFNLSGGSVLDNIFVQDSSLLNFFGTDLSNVLTDANFQGFYSEYTLSGHLLDNTDLTGKEFFVQNGSGARFTITDVPEPGSLALLVSGAVLGAGARWRRRRK